MEGQNMEEEVTIESIIKDLQSKKIQMKEIKVGGEYQYQYRFVGESAEYNLSGKRLHTIVITYIRSGVYFYKLKGYENLGEFHFEQNSYMAHCLINGIV
jgi:hypothetical protein